MNQIKYTFFLFIVFASASLSAQLRPDLFPEDIGTPGGQIVQCYCKPGVRNKSRSKGLQITYSTIGDGTFKDEESGVEPPYSKYSNWSKFKYDLKVPVFNKQKLKVLVGYKFAGERLSFDQIGHDFPETFRQLGKRTLKSSNLTAIATKPLNERQYLAFRIRYTANGTYGGIINFDRRYAIYKAMAVFGVKRNEDFEWGVGISFSKSFRRTNYLPFVVFNRTFLNNWGIEAAFPGYVYGRYNYSAKTIFLAGAEYASSSYRLDVPLDDGTSLDYALNHSELLFLLRWEQQIVPWVWSNLRVGYQMNFSTDFERKAVNTPGFMVDPTNSLFFEIGVFVSPPDSMLK